MSKPLLVGLGRFGQRCRIETALKVPNMLKLILPLAILGTLLAPASEAREARQVAVTYGDLDLSSNAGVKALDQRLWRAFDTICSDSDAAISGNATNRLRRCKVAMRSELAPARNAAIARAQHRSQLSVSGY